MHADCYRFSRCRLVAGLLMLALAAPLAQAAAPAAANPHAAAQALMRAHPGMGQLMARMWMPWQWMNPALRGFMAAPMDAMTQIGSLNAMMLAMNPRLLFGGYPAGAAGAGVPQHLPLASLPGFPTQSLQRFTPNTTTPGVSREAKRNLFESMMMVSPLSLRDMVGIMAEKFPVEDGVSFDDAVDSMKLRANEINFKLVGHNPLWKDVRAITGDEDTPRVEIFQFCDAVVARKILDHVPEFVVFLPCRIALLEDAHGKLWVMTLDWDINWLNYAQNPNNVLAADLRSEATRIRDGIRYIMEGAASGDF